MSVLISVVLYEGQLKWPDHQSVNCGKSLFVSNAVLGLFSLSVLLGFFTNLLLDGVGTLALWDSATDESKRPKL